MKKQDMIRKNGLFWADIVITAVSLVCTAYYLWDIYDYMSFGGFEALFFLLFLFPYFLAMATVLLLLAMAAKTGRRVLAVIAAVVQILSPIPWLLLYLAFGGLVSWFEVLMVVCAGAGVFLLLTLPAVRPTRNGQ